MKIEGTREDVCIVGLGHNFLERREGWPGGGGDWRWRGRNRGERCLLLGEGSGGEGSRTIHEGQFWKEKNERASDPWSVVSVGGGVLGGKTREDF